MHELSNWALPFVIIFLFNQLTKLTNMRKITGLFQPPPIDCVDNIEYPYLDVEYINYNLAGSTSLASRTHVDHLNHIDFLDSTRSSAYYRRKLSRITKSKRMTEHKSYCVSRGRRPRPQPRLRWIVIILPGYFRIFISTNLDLFDYVECFDYSSYLDLDPSITTTLRDAFD